MRRVPQGTVLEIYPGDIIEVGPYIELLKCYRTTPLTRGLVGGPAAAHLIEDAYERASKEELRKLKLEYGTRPTALES